MRPNVLVALLAAAGSGCATINHPVDFRESARSATFVADHTLPDDYPSYATGEGNVYSCRYGIHHLSRGEFTPPKAQVFAALLAKYVPDAAAHEVKLERYDVYYNQRLKNLDRAGQAAPAAIGGFVGHFVGSMVQDAARRNANVFTFQELVIDADPLRPKAAGVHLVGCDDRHEGEYDAAQVSGGSDVIVTWLRFTVDGAPYHVRSFYQFQPEKKADVAKAVAYASERTIEALSPYVAKRAPLPHEADATAPAAPAQPVTPAGPPASAVAASAAIPAATPVIPAAAIAPATSNGRAASDTVTLHYFRPDGRYAGWGLHTWESFETREQVSDAYGSKQQSDRVIQGVTWFSPMKPAAQDASGLVWRIPAAEYGNGRVNYIIHKGDMKDQCSRDMFWLTRDSFEAWVVAGDCKVYLSRDEALRSPNAR